MSKAVLIDNKRIQRIHAILAKIGLANDKEYKRGMVQEYSDGRETSTTGLFADEADRMIEDLNTTVTRQLTPDQIKGDQKRKLILHWAHEMMWELPTTPPSAPLLKTGGESARPRVDMERVNAWCVKSGYLHKPLMEYTTAELSKLVWQFEQVHSDFLKSV